MAFSLYKIIKGLLISEENTLSPKEIEIIPGGTSGTKTTLSSSQTSNKSLVLPDASDTLIARNTTDTLTNKLIDADTNTITNIDNNEIKSNAAIDASKIANGSVSNTEYQYLDGVTSSIQTQLNTNATGLSDHLSDPTGAHAASAISVTPSGNLAATDVQAALVELQLDVDSRALDSALTAHTGANNGVHGVVGNVVGTTDIQTLTNKTINADNNTITNIDDNEIKANAAINATKIGAGTVDNTEFGYLDGVTSAIQTQIDSKQAAATAVTLTGTQTLSNKTLDNSNIVTIKDTNLTIQDDSDATKQVKFEVSGVATATTRTLTIPNANTTITGTDATQTLTNKTINGSNNTITNVSLTTGVTGTLPAGNGGTGLSSYTTGDMIYFTSGTAFTKLPIGTTGYAVYASAGGVPAYSPSVTSNNTVNVRVESARISGAATDTTPATSGDTTIKRQTVWLSGITRNGTGLYTLNFSPSWQSAPSVSLTCASIDNIDFRIETISVSSVQVSARNGAGTLVDVAFDILAIGNK